MSGPALGARVVLTIDGRRLTVPADRTVLVAAREAGIEIPTLCDHPNLEPTGACRLCLVEVTHPDWNGWRNLVTSCLYPVAEGLEVSTGNERVREARRRVLALLAARCPGSPLVAGLARSYGADVSRLAVTEDGDNCILCGLCVRVCETYATSAIVTVSRGATKAVGAFAGDAPADCVGCGGCAAVCPTGNIASARTATDYEIWGRAFATAVATVDPARCVGCGACEEACPFHVARVSMAPAGQRVAQIPTEHCRGCGACVGACPSGAIDQPGFAWTELLGRLRAKGGGAGAAPAHAEARVAVVACHRSGLRSATLPADSLLIEVPCTGRVSLPLLLAGLAAGWDGVLVLGRHATTCRFDGAEEPARRRAAQAAELADLAGWGGERVRFAVPDPGPEGPLAAVEAFIAEMSQSRSSVLARTLPAPAVWSGMSPATLAHEGLDAALALLTLAPGAADRRDSSTAWLAAHGLPHCTPGFPALALGRLPLLAAACGDLVRPVRLPEVAQAALALLARLGLPGAGVWIGDPRVAAGESELSLASALRSASEVVTCARTDADDLKQAGFRATWLDDLLCEMGSSLPRPPEPGVVACDGSPAQVSLIEALGYRAVDVGPDLLPASFAMTPDDRARAEARLALADEAGAVALYCADPLALARWAILTRHGTWRSTRARPALGAQLAWLALAGIPLGAGSLAAGIMSGLAVGLTSPGVRA